MIFFALLHKFSRTVMSGLQGETVVNCCSRYFTGWMLFLLSSQQYQSVEGRLDWALRLFNNKVELREYTVHTMSRPVTLYFTASLQEEWHQHQSVTNFCLHLKTWLFRPVTCYLFPRLASHTAHRLNRPIWSPTLEIGSAGVTMNVKTRTKLGPYSLYSSTIFLLKCIPGGQK